MRSEHKRIEFQIVSIILKAIQDSSVEKVYVLVNEKYIGIINEKNVLEKKIKNLLSYVEGNNVIEYDCKKRFDKFIEKISKSMYA